MSAKIKIANVSDLEMKVPSYALVENTDLVIIKHEKGISVLYGRCHHRGVLLADGFIEGDNLICGVHHWDYRYDTGISEYNNDEQLHKFQEYVEGDELYVDQQEVLDFQEAHPQPFQRDEYLGTYADIHPEDTEPYTGYIKELAKNGLKI